MSLLNPTNAIDLFISTGSGFLQNPSIQNGLDFDDAIVALKRYNSLQLKDHALTTTLNQLARLLREQDIETLTPLYEQVVAALGKSKS